MVELPECGDVGVVSPVTETIDLYCMSLLIRLVSVLKGQSHLLHSQGEIYY